jgi:OmcA/MtrC family decaheme c-type cytochrome
LVCLLTLGLLALMAGCPTTPGLTVSITPNVVTLSAGQSVVVSAVSTDAADTAFTWASNSTAVATVTAGAGAFVPSGLQEPGLNITIKPVRIPADLKPVVTFQASNSQGDLVSLKEMFDVRFGLAYLGTPAATAPATRYINYLMTKTDPDGVPNSGDETSTGVYDGGRLANTTQNQDGTMVYKFKSAIAANYDPTATHALIGQFRRIYTVDGLTYPNNNVYEFRPDGGTKALETRQLVTTDACNQCHTRLSAHGTRRDVRLCVLCHNPQTSNGASTETVDLAVMAHKIHAGSSLPSVAAGGSYKVGSTDFSGVVFPQDIRHCTVCHNTAPQADNYKTQPTLLGCGACHDRTWFGDPSATPAGYENHPTPQADNAQCAICHTPSGTAISVVDAHTPPIESVEELSTDITAVNANAATGALQITVSVKIGETPVTDITTIERLTAILGYPTTDYQTVVSESITGTTPGVLDTTNAATGVYGYTFKAALPIGATNTFAVALASRRSITVGGTAYEQGTNSNGLKYFTLDGSDPVPRRTVVDETKCDKCHDTIKAHGEQRVGVDLCVICHKSTATDIAQLPSAAIPPVTINLKDMLHKVHTGENLENPYTVYGYGKTPYDFKEVLFPGDRRACDICHVVNADKTTTSSIDLIPDDALPTVVKDGAGAVLSDKLPVRAACTGCHDADDADAHTVAMTAGGVESCAVCHGSGAAFDVPVAHKIEP